jgi:hypothetical protein
MMYCANSGANSTAQGFSRFRKIVLASIATAMLAIGSNVHAAPVIIDDFADPDPLDMGNGDIGTLDDNPFISITTSSPGIIGGDRTFTALWPTAGVDIPAGNSARIGEGFVFVSTAGLEAVVLTFDYPSVDGGDLTGGGMNDTFLLPFVYIEGGDSGLISIDIMVETGGDSSTYHDDFAQSPSSPLDYYASFAAFVGSADFTDIDTIKIVINDGESSGNLDMRMESPIITTTVPEPASLSLVIGALMGCTMLGSRRRRRKRVDCNS